MHYCRLFEHRVARWTYLPNYIFRVKYRIRCSIYSSYDPVASVAIVTTAISSYALRKPIAITLLLLMFFPLNLLLPMLGATSIGIAFPLPKHNENKIIKIGSGDKSSTAYFYYTCRLITLLTPQNYVTSYVGIIPLSFNFLSGLNQQVSIPATYPPSYQRLMNPQ